MINSILRPAEANRNIVKIFNISKMTIAANNVLKWALQFKKSALQKILVKYLRFLGGDFYSPPPQGHAIYLNFYLEISLVAVAVLFVQIRGVALQL